MLRLLLCRGAEGGAWTGDRDTAAGPLPVAPAYFAEALGLRLGTPPPPAPALRLARVVSALAAHPDTAPTGFALAPEATAAALLREVDALALHGALRDDLPPALTARLGAVWEAVSPDAHLAAVLRDARTIRLRGAVDLAFPRVELPRAVRAIVDALDARGWPITEPSPTPRPVCEVVHLRDRSPSALARRVATSLAAAEGARVVVAPFETLAAAFAHRGLPNLGAVAADALDASLEHSLRALARDPDDVPSLRALLDHSRLPISRPTRRALCDALGRWPSARAAPWREAVARALTSEDREAVARLDAVIAGDVAAPDALRALCTAATPPRADAEAGGAWVREPGAVLADTDHLVLWELSAVAPPPSPLDALGPVTRAHLAARGVALPTPSQRRRARRDELFRAVARTRARVWLCDPETDDDGAERAASAVVPWLDGALRALGHPGVVAEPRPSPDEVTPSPAPRPRRVWPVARALRTRTESPTSVATLLGCSLRHALRYSARLPERDEGLPNPALLAGRVAHEVIATALLPLGDPADTEARTIASLDAFIATHAPALRRPAERPTLHRLRARTGRAAGALAATLAGADGVETEIALRGNDALGGIRVSGRADLVARAPAVVLDLKWSLGHHRHALAGGTALQLALYAWALRAQGGGAWPAVGYAILESAEVFVSAPSPLPGARAVPGPSVARTVDAAAKALDAVRAERAGGSLIAAGVRDATAAPIDRDVLDADTLRVAPGCRWCSYEALCGRALRTEAP